MSNDDHRHQRKKEILQTKFETTDRQNEKAHQIFGWMYGP